MREGEPNAVRYQGSCLSSGRTRLYRWRLPDAYFIDDDRLDQLAGRIDDLQVELNALRPPGTAE